jgi:cytochrome c553
MFGPRREQRGHVAREAGHAGDDDAAGYPRGDCGSPGGGTNPYATPPTCTSGAFIRGEEEIGAAMHPGGACISCHRTNGEGEAPSFTVAGTVFPTAHEYDDCVSTAAGRGQVVITGNDGVIHTLGIGASGNFYTELSIALPYRAKVVAGGKERVMSSSQQSGDCNSCHTSNGANGAPGRVMLP